MKVHVEKCADDAREELIVTTDPRIPPMAVMVTVEERAHIDRLHDAYVQGLYERQHIRR